MKTKTLRRWLEKFRKAANQNQIPQSPRLPDNSIVLYSRKEGGPKLYQIQQIAIARELPKWRKMEILEANMHGQEIKDRIIKEEKEYMTSSIFKTLQECGAIEFEERRDPYSQELIIETSLKVAILPEAAQRYQIKIQMQS